MITNQLQNQATMSTSLVPPLVKPSSVKSTICFIVVQLELPFGNPFLPTYRGLIPHHNS